MQLTLSTPCMKFAFDPHAPPDAPAPEQAFHTQAAARFEAILAIVGPALDALLPSALAGTLAHLIAYDPDGPPALASYGYPAFRAQGGGPCRVSFTLPLPEFAELALCFADLPSDEELAQIQSALHDKCATTIAPLIAHL